MAVYRGRSTWVDAVQFHDYHLRGYAVTDAGATITLDLVWDYPGQRKLDSSIRFSGVALYRFTHTSAAIITDIEEVPLPGLVDDISEELSRWAHEHGLSGWRGSVPEYKAYLVE